MSANKYSTPQLLVNLIHTYHSNGQWDVTHQLWCFVLHEWVSISAEVLRYRFFE